MTLICVFHKFLSITLTILLLGCSTSSVFASDAVSAGQSTKDGYKLETSYDFDDDIVEGSLLLPSGQFIFAHCPIREIKGLIAEREHFFSEMAKSAENL